MARPFLTLFALVCGTWWISTAHGSVSMALELRQLVAEATTIGVVRVVDQESYWDERRRIVTDVRLRVEEAWSEGLQPGDELMLRTLGGVVGKLGMKVSGEPHFVPASRVVLFARVDAGTTWLRAIAASQGVMPVVEDSNGTYVYPGGAGQRLTVMKHGQLQTVLPAVAAPTPLGTLRDQVRALLEQSDRR
jgi:hypothetical protein